MERFSAVAVETSKLSAHDLNMIEPFEPYISRCFCYFLVLSTLRGHVGLHFTFVGIHRDGKRTLAGCTRSQRNPLGGCLRRACPWSLQYALGTLGEVCCVVDAEDVTSKVIPSVTLQKVIESQIHGSKPWKILENSPNHKSLAKFLIGYMYGIYIYTYIQCNIHTNCTGICWVWTQ